MKREYKEYIFDILSSMEKASKFVEGMTYEDFLKDEKTVFAVIRALEVIGEAVKNLPEDIRKKYPEIPWRGMAGMRDVLIHGYFEVDPQIVWETVKNRIPEVKPLFERILEEDY